MFPEESIETILKFGAFFSFDACKIENFKELYFSLGFCNFLHPNNPFIECIEKSEKNVKIF
jgi:hypothetical protein